MALSEGKNNKHKCDDCNSTSNASNNSNNNNNNNHDVMPAIVNDFKYDDDDDDDYNIHNNDAQALLPLVIWKDHIFPLLDRTSWNSLVATSSCFWRQRKLLGIPSWPNCGRICIVDSSTSTSKSTLLFDDAVSEVAGGVSSSSSSSSSSVPTVVNNIKISKEWLAIGCRDGSIIVWHVRDGKGTGGRNYSRNLKNGIHQGAILGLHIINDKWLVSICEEKHCLWNLQEILDHDDDDNDDDDNDCQNNEENPVVAQTSTTGTTTATATATATATTTASRKRRLLVAPQDKGGKEKTSTRTYSPTWEMSFNDSFNMKYSLMEGFPNHPEYILVGHCGLMTVWKFEEEEDDEEEQQKQQQQKQQPKLNIQQALLPPPDASSSRPLITCLSISNTHLACVFGGSSDNSTKIRLYEYNSSVSMDLPELFETKHIWKAHHHLIKSLKFSPDGRYLASSSLGFLHNTNIEATIGVWDLHGQNIYKWSPNDSPNINIYSLSFLPYSASSLLSSPSSSFDGGGGGGNGSGSSSRWLLATGGVNGKINIWDIKSSSTNGAVTTATNTNVEGNDDDAIYDDDDDDYDILNNTIGRRPQSLGKFCHDADGTATIYALDTFGSNLVSGGRDGTIRLWSK